MATLSPPPRSGNDPFDRWARLLYEWVKGALSSTWSLLDFTGSNLTDIATRNHNDLQNIQGGAATERYHLTAAEHTALGVLPAHNDLTGMQGGIGPSFQSNAFQLNAFQPAEEYHLTGAEYASILSGYNGTLTTASLVGKTVTIANGIITDIS